MSRSTPVRGSSPPLRSRPATAAMLRPPARTRPRVRAKIPVSRRSTVMPPTARASLSACWPIGRHRQRHQVPAAADDQGSLPEGPLHHRTGRQDRHLPDRHHRADPARHRAPCRDGQVRRGLPRLPAQYTASAAGRTITIGPHEAQLAAARTRQQDPARTADYRATRPKAEPKIGHLMRRRHGGRRARVRGQVKVAAGSALPAAAINLSRPAIPGVAASNGSRPVASTRDISVKAAPRPANSGSPRQSSAPPSPRNRRSTTATQAGSA